MPGPPIFMGADSVSWISKVPEIGDHWVVSPRHSKHFLKDAVPAYKTALERVGRPFKGLPMIRELCVAESTRAAEERIKQAFEEMYKLYQRWGQPGEPVGLPVGIAIVEVDVLTFHIPEVAKTFPEGREARRRTLLGV